MIAIETKINHLSTMLTQEEEILKNVSTKDAGHI